MLCLSGFELHSRWVPLTFTLFTGNCQVETLFSSCIVIKRNKTSLLFLLPKQTRQTYRLRAVSLFFYCSQSTTNNDQFRVNTNQTELSQRTE